MPAISFRGLVLWVRDSVLSVPPVFATHCLTTDDTESCSRSSRSVSSASDTPAPPPNLVSVAQSAPDSPTRTPASSAKSRRLFNRIPLRHLRGNGSSSDNTPESMESSGISTTELLRVPRPAWKCTKCGYYHGASNPRPLCAVCDRPHCPGAECCPVEMTIPPLPILLVWLDGVGGKMTANRLRSIFDQRQCAPTS